ncbi:MAG: acyltransferase family protein [Candidatus Obscuribacterales bacterium]|nr:acyltransferase family protein [Candidatus Obscuribacterales bacterium]
MLESLAKNNPSFCERYANKEDEFGFSLETFALWERFFRFLFEDYFKAKVTGIENIPSEGRVLLVGNHSGLLPMDGALLTIAMCNGHPAPRRVRYLATDWFFSVPGLREWSMETGQVRATKENAISLLNNDEIVGIYPEGIRGVGKTFRERYRVHDFHPGFVQLAISTQTPLIPIATVGGDEIFPNFANAKSMARLLRMPFFPLTLTFPWLPFPMPFVPLPVRWLIKVHKPIVLDYPPEKASDRKLVLKIARDIQYQIQKDLNELLRERKSVFSGWDGDSY